jgi:hypothetical protein
MSPPLVDLPISYYKGIGRVVQAHAILEHNVSELVYALLFLSRAEGQLAFEYRAASTMLTLARRLIEVRGITSAVDLVALEDQVKDCCQARDQLAHGLWIAKGTQIALRLVEGNYETPEGKRSRPILPEGKTLPDKYFDQTRTVILDTATAVLELTETVKALLSA